MLQRKSQPISYDPMIIPRVKQYLEEHVHQTFVDVGVMARDLQQRYREYTRRKAVPFRLLVEQAYRTVLHSYGLDSNPSTDGEEEGLSDVEVMDESVNRNQMSNTLTSMYMGKSDNRTPATSTMPSCTISQSGDGGEAIDISSDEEDEQPHQQQQHSGPSAASAEARGADEDKADFIATHVASNKHVTVTKVVRANKVREDDNSNESIASSNGKEAPESKRRRVDNGTSITAQLLTQIRNNPQLLGVQPKPTSGGKKAANSGNNQTGDRGKTKKYRKEVASRVVSTTFEDVGGMDRVLKHLCELLLHVKHPEIYRHIGLPPPRGFLLHGPPGSGKTLLAQAIAGQLKIELIEVPATELVASLSGESEERIREVFEQAASMAPCVLFIDEIDAISSNRINAQKDMERRIVSQLLNSLDTLGKLEGGDGVIVIGATNRPDAIDPALRRIGRFDQEISLGIPDREARRQILEIICRKLKISEDIDYGELAKLTPGYVGADLLALATRAANTAIKRLFTQQEQKILLESSDDVVAIDDEPVEVVNIDDEKEDIPPVLPDDEETVQPVEVAGEGCVSNEAAGVSLTDQAEKATEEKAPEESIAEPAVSTSSEMETTVPTSEVVENENKQPINDEITPMDVDQSANQPSSDGEAANATAVVSAAVEADNAGTSNGPTVEALLPDVVANGAVATEEKEEEHHRQQQHEEEAEAPTKQTPLGVPPKELTLDKMLDLLLNQQNALPATELDGLHIQRDDFIESLKTVQPSAKREGFITVPDVTWNDIGSLGDIREELKLAILAPVKYPQRLKLLGLTSPSGVLLCGPPGCGKTLLAKAVANEAGINFISVKGPELLNMYVGESERAVRQCFQRARNSAPCVIFFDEFDALCPKRSDTASNSAGTRVVNQLLTEMDGIEERRGVFLMAATNRPDIVDPAVLRPGRLDKILYVGLPALTDRVDILRALTKNRAQPPLADDVEFEKVAELTEGYTGADLAGLVRQASLQTLKDSIVEAGAQEDADDGTQLVGTDGEMLLRVRMDHFLEAIRNIKPSVNAEDKKHYEKLRLKYGTTAALC
ncbi:peroxisome assembly factor-2 (peroxisomal-type atpase 1) [Anopheles darlingi]|uniref:Peroxisome assembly factor-2 (Peroxisomal-type atpase 1) n=1 Tax=Anopheles darlingi TaxID=43151 RepID=W5JB11_ANODA|nr:peroxisome assembly factor-2 (peroxisomal-type atpase 1) [Anopheles darlingi]